MVEDLITEDSNNLKRLLRCNRVYQHVAMNPNQMFGVQNAVLVLDPRRAQVRWSIIAAAGRFRNETPGSERLPDPPCRLFRSRSLALDI